MDGKSIYALSTSSIMIIQRFSWKKHEIFHFIFHNTLFCFADVILVNFDRGEIHLVYVYSRNIFVNNYYYHSPRSSMALVLILNRHIILLKKCFG